MKFPKRRITCCTVLLVALEINKLKSISPKESSRGLHPPRGEKHTDLIPRWLTTARTENAIQKKKQKKKKKKKQNKQKQKRQEQQK